MADPARHRSEVFTVGGLPHLPVYADASTVILGASGAGKTQWIRRLLGLAPPPLVVARAGREIDVFARRRLMGYVADNDGVFLSQTARENVSTQHAGPPIDPMLVGDALSMVAMADKADVPTAGLSWHERRRVALARAIALERPVLVLDGELDPAFAALLPAVLVQATWLSAVIRTATSITDAVREATTVALLADEVVVAVGTLDELLDSDDPTVKAALAWVTP